MKKIKSLSLILLLSFSGYLYGQELPWELRENQDGIPVYTRKVEGSSILEYKGDVIINAPLPEVISLFEDEKQIPRWYYQCVRSHLIKNEGPDRKVIYLVLHFPWPVAPRDFIFRRTKSVDPKGTISYSLTALPETLPAVKGMVRVHSIRSVWTFKKLAKGRTEVLFQQHTDPEGSVPASLVNQLAVDTPYYSLRNLRKLITATNA